MGLRMNDDFKLTVAAAFLCKFVKDADHYISLKEEVTEDILRFLGKQTDKEVDIFLNTADDPKRGAGGCYLTVTGTSAEMGDSGAVGRGNRVNGLITPYRPMTMEAAAGKNPITHVGKIYNLLAFRAAEKIFSEVKGINEVRVRLLSQIGRPIDQPLIAAAEISGGNAPGVKSSIQKILDEQLARVRDITTLVLNNDITVF